MNVVCEKIPCGAAATAPQGQCAPAGSREVDARGCGDFQGLRSHSPALAAGSLDNGEKPASHAAGPAANNDYSSLCSTTTLAPIGGALNIAVRGRW